MAGDCAGVNKDKTMTKLLMYGFDSLPPFGDDRVRTDLREEGERQARIKAHHEQFAVPAGATATLVVSAQKRHVPKELTTRGVFWVIEVRVGIECVFRSNEEQVHSFSTLNMDRDETCEVNEYVSVVVKNMSKEPARFIATMVGEYEDEA